MNGLIEAARRIAASRAEALIDMLAETAAEELDGVAFRREEGGVTLRGARLARRLAFVAPVALLLAAIRAKR